MGKLAAAGAIAGLGKGLIEEAKNTRDDDRRSMDEARETRLRDLEQNYRVALASRREEFEATQQGQEVMAKAAAYKEQLAGQQSLQTDSQRATAAEGAADRKSREKIAGMQASARSGSTSNRRAWEKTLLPGTPTGEVDPNTRMPILGEAAIAITSPTGQTYIQKGDKFFKQGSSTKEATRGPNNTFTPGWRRASARNLEELAKNPERADEFARVYGWLPESFIANLPSSVPGRSSTSGSEED